MEAISDRLETDVALLRNMPAEVWRHALAVNTSPDTTPSERTAAADMASHWIVQQESFSGFVAATLEAADQIDCGSESPEVRAIICPKLEQISGSLDGLLRIIGEQPNAD